MKHAGIVETNKFENFVRPGYNVSYVINDDIDRFTDFSIYVVPSRSMKN